MTDTPDVDFEALVEHLRTERGVDFTGYKRASLQRLVGRRMAASGTATWSAYQEHLEADPGEFTALFDALLINVTAFFRDQEAWTALQRDVLPRLLAGLGPDEPIRVWSAACATGEEAYTLAIVLAEMVGVDAFCARVKIYATDIDEKALATARAGRYPRSALADLAPELVARYFTGEGDQLTFRSDLRACLIFGRHDLLQDAPISRVALLSCRNILMYLNHEAQAKVLSRLAFGMLTEGALLLGRAEMLLTHKDLFTPLDLGNRLFRKRLGSDPQPVRRLVEGVSQPAQVVEAAFANAPEALVVIDDQGLFAMANQAAVRMLDVQPQEFGRPFLELDVAARPVELAAALSTARRERRTVDLRDQHCDQRWYDVQVLPLTTAAGELLGLQVGWFDVTRYHELTTALDAVQGDRQKAHRDLQEAHETLETTNEELQSAVEELETTNEEMQSTNEELETMNEELQSTNEELQYLNEALRDRTREVNQVNSFLESILVGLRGGVVVVDRELVVRVWNVRAEGMWGLRAYEAEGKYLLNLEIGLPVAELRGALKVLLEGERETVDLSVAAVNRFGVQVRCALACSPLRDTDGAISGAIVVMEEAASHLS